MKTEQRYIENKGNSPMYVGSVMIPPGEGKIVEMPVLRSELAPPAAPAGPNLVEQLTPLLDQGIKDIVPQLKDLTFEALDLLEQLEQGGKTRKGVIDAIGAERMRRANARLEAEEAIKAAAALDVANQQLLQAKVGLVNLPPTATADERAAAEAAVEEAQAQVDALSAGE